MKKNSLFKRIKLFTLLTALACTFICACSSSESKKGSDVKAYITNDTEISIPSPVFDDEKSFDGILTTTYNNKKNSLFVSSVIRKNSITVSGLTLGYVKLFTLTYDSNGIKAEYSVPKAMLPPVNQVLLDIMLSYKHNLSNELPEGFKVADKNYLRMISYTDRTKMRKVIYKIEYKSMKDKKLPNKIINFEFDYTINFKYL